MPGAGRVVAGLWRWAYDGARTDMKPAAWLNGTAFEANERRDSCIARDHNRKDVWTLPVLRPGALTVRSRVGNPDIKGRE